MTETNYIDEMKRRPEKFPQIIRNNIRKSEADLEHYKEQARIVSGETESPVWIAWKHEEHKQFLPRRTQLTLRTDKGEITVYLKRDGDGLVILSDQRFYLSAEAANMMSVSLEKP